MKIKGEPIMPCNSDYMEPTIREEISRRMCCNIVYMKECLRKPVEKWIKEGAENYYGKSERYEELEGMVAKMFDALTPEQIDKIVYNARDKRARTMANDFERYMNEKSKQLKKENKQKEEKKVLDKALSRLRAEEIEILNKYYKRR